MACPDGGTGGRDDLATTDPTANLRNILVPVDGSPASLAAVMLACSIARKNKGKVYAVSSLGKLVCLDATSGKQVWEKSYTKEFGGSVQNWGYTESVLVDGDKLICAPGGSRSAVVALKPDTGEVIWRAAVSGGRGYGYSSPIKATVGGVSKVQRLVRVDG